VWRRVTSSGERPWALTADRREAFSVRRVEASDSVFVLSNRGKGKKGRGERKGWEEEG
jgi:hypothetical protein